MGLSSFLDLKRYFKLIIKTCFISTVFFTLNANAKNYFVRTDGSDASCNGSANLSNASAPNCAYSSVSKAAKIAAPGDLVTIQSGIYSGNITFDQIGTSSAPITIKGTRSTIIKGNVNINGQYIILDEITISPPSAGGFGAVTINGNNNTLKNCLVTNYGAKAGDQATAIIFGSTGAFNTVEGCTIKDLDDIDVFHIFGHDQIIRNNYITNIKQLNYALNHTDVFQSWGWEGNFVYNILIESNLVTNSSCQLGNTSNDNFSTLHDITFRNNIFANIGAAFFSGIPKTKFYNNIFYNVGDAQGYAISYYNQNFYSSIGFEVKNNVFIDNMKDVDDHSGVNTATITNNYTTHNASPGFISGGDPKFVNLIGLDFHIQSGSVLIDKGVTLPDFNTDKDNKIRSSTWDIGPYEFGVASPTSPLPLRPPQNLRIGS